jgi:hypothetical protein
MRKTILIITVLAASTMSIAAQAAKKVGLGGTNMNSIGSILWKKTNDLQHPYSRQLACAKRGGVDTVFMFDGAATTVYPATTEVSSSIPVSLSLSNTAIATGSDNKIYFFGGGSNMSYTDKILSYDPTTTASPAQISTILPTPQGTVFVGNRGYSTAVPVGSKIYVFGGFNGSSVLRNVLEFDVVSKSITQKMDMPTGLASATAVYKKVGGQDYVYLIAGGRTAYALSGVTHDNYQVFRYNIAANSWSTLPATANLPSGNDAAPKYVSMDAKGNIHLLRLIGDEWTLDLTSNMWNQFNFTGTARENAGFIACGGNNYLIGGCKNCANKPPYPKVDYPNLVEKLWWKMLADKVDVKAAQPM